LAGTAHIPVVNGLSDLRHPCQVLSDCFTIVERYGSLDGLRVAFLGDGNNMANSWIGAATRFGFEFVLACPPGYEPDPDMIQAAKAASAKVTVTSDPVEAITGANVLYTDVWTSMGQEEEKEERAKRFRGFQLNAKALELAKKDAVVMHCLPAHRGEEITADVIDGPQSIVLDQAENRMHVQKGILAWLNEHTTR
jgi:ornithine carbamoyltransferase